jgi:hypothetical protein
MIEFLLELYISQTDCAAVPAAAERLGRAAAELTAEGKPVRVEHSIFVPEDETCYVLVAAASVEHVHDMAARAALLPERVVEATVASGHRPPRVSD